jgi:hypothetical protein
MSENKVVLLRAGKRRVVVRVGGERRQIGWDELREAAANGHPAYAALLQAAEDMRREQQAAAEAAAEAERRASTGPWALALLGWWEWHAPGCETYGAVGMPPNGSTASLVRRFQTQDEALAALEEVWQAEKARSRPWEGTVGDYEVRPYRASHYIPEEDRDRYGDDPDFIQWA